MRTLRLLGIVLVAAVVAAAVATLVSLNRPNQVGRGPIASGGSSSGALTAVQRAQPSVVRIERGSVAVGLATPPVSPSPAGSSGGTGLVIDARGYVLTAEALVAGADSISVAVPGAKTVSARVVGSDPDDALSLLKIDAPNLHALAMGGASALDTGSGVVLLAAPGYPQVAVGAVASAHASALVGDPSSPGRQRPLNDLLALDVAGRDGQLGAPVLDAAGRLAGMVVAGGPQVYAADMTQAQALVQQLVDSGHASPPSLGFQYQQLSVSDAADLDVPAGVRVVSVETRATAQGLAAGDVVISANGTVLDPGHPLSHILRGMAVKQAVTLVVRPASGAARRTISLDVQLVSA